MADEKDFLIATNLNLIENIKFSDQKAALFIALNSAIIGGLYSAELLILDVSTWKQTWFTVLSLLAFVPLITGILLAVYVVWPRGEEMARKAKNGKLVIPSKIAHDFKDEAAYCAAATTANEHVYKNEYSAMIYCRGEINDTKYKVLKRSIRWSVFGWFMAVLFLAISSAVTDLKKSQATGTEMVTYGEDSSGA